MKLNASVVIHLSVLYITFLYSYYYLILLCNLKVYEDIKYWYKIFLILTLFYFFNISFSSIFYLWNLLICFLNRKLLNLVCTRTFESIAFFITVLEIFSTLILILFFFLKSVLFVNLLSTYQHSSSLWSGYWEISRNWIYYVSINYALSF